MVHRALTAGSAALLLCAPAGLAASPYEANVGAKRAANHYTNSKFGIGVPQRQATRYWHATCGHLATHWVCGVVMNGGQCQGKLRLHNGSLLPYGYRIGCGE